VKEAEKGGGKGESKMGGRLYGTWVLKMLMPISVVDMGISVVDMPISVVDISRSVSSLSPLIS
jgi:hypothetical protein